MSNPNGGWTLDKVKTLEDVKAMKQQLVQSGDFEIAAALRDIEKKLEHQKATTSLVDVLKPEQIAYNLRMANGHIPTEAKLAGKAGQVLFDDGTGVKWVDASQAKRGNDLVVKDIIPIGGPGRSMRMEEHYFTPKVEDIHVGYECEVDAPAWKGKKFIVDENQIQYADFCINAGILRVPYLTRDQIEKEGWRYTNNSEAYDCPIFKKGIWMLFFNKHEVWIQKGNQMKYDGKCPDINTLRYICRLLEI